MTNVIDSLKRLERLGSEDSAQAQKLMSAACVVSETIADLLPDDAELCLPRGYGVGFSRRSLDGENRPILGLTYVDYETQNWRLVDSSRAAALSFAEAIATGWLDELAFWLQERGNATSAALATLEQAAKALRN